MKLRHCNQASARVFRADAHEAARTNGDFCARAVMLYRFHWHAKLMPSFALRSSSTASKTHKLKRDQQVMSIPTAIIYARTATENPNFLLEQIEVCRRKAVDEGLEVVEQITDAVASGNTFSRPGMHRLCSAIESGSCSVVLFKDWSRIGRNANVIEHIRELANSNGVMLLAVSSASIDLPQLIDIFRSHDDLKL